MEKTTQLERQDLLTETKAYYMLPFWVALIAFIIAGGLFAPTLLQTTKFVRIAGAILAVAEIVFLAPQVINNFNLNWLKALALALVGALFFILLETKNDFVQAICSANALLAVCVFAYSSFELIRLYWYIDNCEKTKKSIADKKGFEIRSGALKSCKTLTSYINIIIKCLFEWEELKFQLRLYNELKDEDLNELQLLDKKEIQETFDFYNSNPSFFPLLVSNVNFKINGQEPIELTGGHLLQIERLPYRVNGVIDESTTVAHIDIYKDRPYTLDNFLRFLCHELGERVWWLVIEQSLNKPYNGIRNSATQCTIQYGSKWVMQPTRLLNKIERLRERLLGTESKNYALAKKLYTLIELSKNIGFSIFTFDVVGSENSGGNKLDSDVKAYAPRKLPFFFDCRAFRNTYKCKNQPITAPKFKSLQVDENYTDKCIIYHNKRTKWKKIIVRDLFGTQEEE